MSRKINKPEDAIPYVFTHLQIDSNPTMLTDAQGRKVPSGEQLFTAAECEQIAKKYAYECIGLLKNFPSIKHTKAVEEWESKFKEWENLP